MRGETTTQCLEEEVNQTVSTTGPRIIQTFSDDYDFEQRLLRMKVAASRHPVAIVLKSECDLFFSYHSGILTDDSTYHSLTKLPASYQHSLIVTLTHLLPSLFHLHVHSGLCLRLERLCGPRCTSDRLQRYS